LYLVQYYVPELNSLLRVAAAVVVLATAAEGERISVEAERISVEAERTSVAAERISVEQERASVGPERISVERASVGHTFAGSAALAWEFRAAISRTSEAHIFAVAPILAV
jgi:hypothetical protein